MNRNRQILFKTLLFALFATVGLSAQESKTYKETFNVSDDAVLKINTTHTDIEFDTWDKNQVEIVATVTLEGASDKEATDYFENSPFKMLGNSNEIEVSTSGKNSFSYTASAATDTGNGSNQGGYTSLRVILIQNKLSAKFIFKDPSTVILC